MITIPKKVEYSVLLISHLSKNKDKTVSLKEISDKMFLPYRFLGQLANQLKQSGILESKEGMGGGYKLKKGWDEKNLYDLIVGLKEDKRMVKCLGSNHCTRSEQCSMRKIWGSLEQNFVDELKKLKLSEV